MKKQSSNFEFNPLHYPILLQFPHRFTDIPAWHEHMPFAFLITALLKPKTFVELGTHKGDSYSAFCQAVNTFGLPTRCYAVDHWRGDPHAGIYGEEVYREFQAYHDPLYSHFSSLLREDFDQAVTRFAEGSIDLLHIDGAHYYEAVKHDFETWLPKMSETGVVLFHDITVHEMDFGVWKLWEEIREEFPSSEFLFGHGLGILAVGKAVPKEFQQFMRELNENRELFGAFFAALGTRLELSRRCDKQQKLERESEAAFAAHVAEMESLAYALRLEKDRLLAQETLAGKQAAAIAQRDALVGELEDLLAAAKRAEKKQQLRSDESGRQNHELNVRVNELEFRLRQISFDNTWNTGLWFVDKEYRKKWFQEKVVRAKRALKAASRAKLKEFFHEIAVYEAIKKSGLFDEKFYLLVNPEVREMDIPPLEHYIYYGAQEKRQPNPLFFVDHYLKENPDVAAAGINPLYHFIQYGAKEGRNPNPLFDTAYYLDNNPEVGKLGINPLFHFIHYGVARRISPSPLFDLGSYLDRYGDVADAKINPLLHYLLFGKKEGRVPFFAGKYETEFVPPANRYQVWLEMNAWNARAERHLQEALAEYKAEDLPLISVIMPVYNTPVAYLRLAAEAVFRQVYGKWELCVADDASANEETLAYLRELEKNPKVNICWRTKNGHISEATNSAAALAKGDFLLFLDHDDELAPDALAETALAVLEQPETDIVYSDSDKIDAEGKRSQPHFKPDWSPELALSYMYACQVLALRRKLFAEAGGCRAGFEGSQDHDLFLRVSEKARRITHIPRVLYHWRSIQGSTAYSGNEKPYGFEAGRLAVEQALQRRGIQAKVSRPEWAVQGGNAIFQHEFPDQGPEVTLIIPTRDHKEILQRCLDSLQRTTYQNYRVLIADNDSQDAETRAYLETLPFQVVRIRCPRDEFNFSYLNNQAVSFVTSPYVLFLNDDTEVMEPGWLSQMMGYAQIPGVGAVGAVLYYPTGLVQHAGVAHGLYEGFLPDHVGKHRFYEDAVRFPRNYSAVTAACMLTRRELFLRLGGFDEDLFPVDYNDVDYGYRLEEQGYRSVIAPQAKLIHYENVSRGRTIQLRGKANYKNRYSFRCEKYFNPNLDIGKDEGLVRPRRVMTRRKNKIRTLMCTHNLNWEGAPLFQLELAAEMKKRGILEPILFSPQEGVLRKEFEELGIEVLVEATPFYDAIDLQAYQAGIGRFSKILKERKIELLHANTVLSFYAVDAAYQAGLPSLWTVHENNPYHGFLMGVIPELSRRGYECFQYPYRVAFVANATRKEYERLNSRFNFEVIPGSLLPEPLETGKKTWTRESARRALGISGEDVTVLFLGTICKRKGQHDLARALESFSAEEFNRLRVLFVGSRPNNEYVQQLKELLEVLPQAARARVEIIPETDQTAVYYRAADIFVCASRDESYPRVILEALAYGLPIVSTPVDGINEQIQNGVQSYFFQPGNVRSLANGIRELMHNPERRKAFGEAAEWTFRSLPNFDETMSRYEQIFQEAYFTKVPEWETEMKGLSPRNPSLIKTV